MKISIITPAFGQLDWLRMCVASVADQVGTRYESAEQDANQQKDQQKAKGEKVGSAKNKHLRTFAPSNIPTSRLAIEHIIQDGGTPGIEEFAKEMGEELMLRYGGELVSDLQTFELLHFRTASGYTLRVFKEPDAGMYDAINKGIARISGDLWAWLNCDEQYLPGTLAYVTKWFSRHPETDILCGDALLTDEKGYALSYRRIVTPSWLHTRLVHLASLSCASFYRRSIVDRGGLFDTQWRSIGDAEWMARMLKAGIRVKACGHLLSSFAFTGQNTSESPLASKEGARWRMASEAPAAWMKGPVILAHRFRKLLAGSYRRHIVNYSLHQAETKGRVFLLAEAVSWNWPGSEKLKNDKPAGKEDVTRSVAGGGEFKETDGSLSISHWMHQGKLALRNFGLRVIDLFASDIRDCVTGGDLGRGLVLGWKGRTLVIGHPTLPPLIPRFLPQKRLTYWKQSVGFTTHARPDFPRLYATGEEAVKSERVINVVMCHLAGEALDHVLSRWKGVCPEEDLWVSFGGSREEFESISYPRKVFVSDPALRRKDQQRGKQSYTGGFQEMARALEGQDYGYVYFCEYDHVPLIKDLNHRQVEILRRQGADAMGHWLYRVDGTSHFHMLYHEADPNFVPYWRKISKREDPSVVLSMLGSGSFWNREVFIAVTTLPQRIPCYHELYLPTLAHHLGFRVRGWREGEHMISNLPTRDISIDNARSKGCWTVHPVKG